MRLVQLAVAAALVAVAFSGCLGAGDAPAAAAGGTAALPEATHATVGAVEPDELVAPTFRLLGAVARGGPAYGAGEPSVWAGLDGTVYLAFPGCDRGVGPSLVVGGGACEHGVIYESADGGDSWMRLNDDTRGRLTRDGPAANGDADVAADAAGNVYASNLGGGGIQAYRRDAGGDAWTHLGDVVPEDHWADRQWMAAAAPGQLVMTWMGGKDREHRQVAVTTTFDGGDTWTDVAYLGDDIGWLGTVQFAPDGERAFIPYTQAVRSVGPQGLLFGAEEFHLFVARSLDGGRTWESLDTNVSITTSTQGGHWSGVLMAPAMDVTGDGTLALVWAEETLDATGLTSRGSVVKMVASTDDGASWTEPVALSTRAGAIMPWVTGGAGDRVAVTYFASDVPLDTDYAGMWDLVAVVVDGVATGAPELAETLVEEGVHEGGACTRGGGCFLTASDRALLDFFESDLLPDGRLVVAYPADPLDGGKHIEIRVAVQEGGTPLLAPDAPPNEDASTGNV